MAATIYSPDNLPNGMIGLHTSEGQKMLEETHVVNLRMIEQFTKQVNRTYCGPASIAVLVNALNLAYRIKYKEIQGHEEEEVEYFKHADTGQFHVTEDDIVKSEDVKEYLSSKTDINKHGLTIQQLEDIVNILGFGVNVYLACGNGICENDAMKKKVNDVVRDQERILKNSDEFRKFAEDHLQRPVTGLIINYNLTLLGYKNLSGHFSPLAAYDKSTDMFLVMDVWPDTPPAWVKTESLFNAMSSLDDSSHLPRGLLHIHELLY